MPPTQVTTSLSRPTVSWIFSFPFLLVFVVSFLILLSPNTACPVDVTLAWDANTEENLAGYKIFYRENGQSYDYYNPAWEGADTICTIYNLDDNAAYFFVARAFDTSGNESGDSNEVYYQPSLNLAPIAEAGPSQTVHVGSLVSLDGNGSYDPDGNCTLSYTWEIMLAPQGSTAALSDPNSVGTTFTADLVGDYTIQLVVTDCQGVSSAPDQVKISTENSPPVAVAAEDQAVIMVNTEVQLNGNPSWDPDGDCITYAWTMITRPTESEASLSDPASPNPIFVADVRGDYVIELVVSDAWASSEADFVTVSFDNIAPVADAGVNQAVLVGDTVNLDGSASYDANNDPLHYSWGLTTKPADSSAEIFPPDSAQTNFVADTAGTYVASLLVNDGCVDSEASNVTIVATSTHNEVVEDLDEVIDTINGLDPGDFKNRNMQNTLTNEIIAVLEKVDQGLCQQALNKLEHDVLTKTNGCAETGPPDRNDWITNCPAQGQVYPIIMETIDLLSTMVP